MALLGGFFDAFGCRKVGLADGEIDGVGIVGDQVGDFTDA